MILDLNLSVENDRFNVFLPFNYQYCLSAVIYNIIKKADASFAEFLHDTGYGQKRFKLFTFSDINITFTSKGDRMLLLSKEASMRICFHLPQATVHFVKGLFLKETFTIGDQNSHVNFRINDVAHYIPTLSDPIDDLITVILEPISPLVVGEKNNDCSKYRYYSPYELNFVEWLVYSWIEKYKVVSLKEKDVLFELKKKIVIEPLFFGRPPCERTITIKSGTIAAQKLRGYTKFRLKVTAPPDMIELALSSGMGLKNSIGMGCMKLIKCL
jgi:CRISPR-associated endoribonuclease Cas6